MRNPYAKILLYLYLLNNEQKVKHFYILFEYFIIPYLYTFYNIIIISTNFYYLQDITQTNCIVLNNVIHFLSNIFYQRF